MAGLIPVEYFDDALQALHKVSIFDLAPNGQGVVIDYPNQCVGAVAGRAKWGGATFC